MSILFHRVSGIAVPLDGRGHPEPSRLYTKVKASSPREEGDRRTGCHSLSLRTGCVATSDPDHREHHLPHYAPPKQPNSSETGAVDPKTFPPPRDRRRIIRHPTELSAGGAPDDDRVTRRWSATFRASLQLVALGGSDPRLKTLIGSKDQRFVSRPVNDLSSEYRRSS